ncbi:MAG: hypothetical protein Tsb0020_08830 [Haliangiales bacterium]
MNTDYAYRRWLVAALMMMVGLWMVSTSAPAWAQRGPGKARSARAAASPTKAEASAAVEAGGEAAQPGEAAEADAEEPLPPWAEGTTEEARARARELYEQGNRLLADGLFSAAASKYRQALTDWQHPGIHYHLMLALINLDRPIEAFASAGESLRYGEAALGPEHYRDAMVLRAVLARQVSEIEVVCDEPGAIVTLDGAPLLVGPGRERRLLAPGQYQLVASKDGYRDAAETITASPDRVTEVTLALDRDPGPPVRRWAAWKPWAVVGGGATLVAVGVLINQNAVSSFERSDTLLARSCPTGCYPGEYPPAYSDLVASGNRDRTISRISYALGAAAIIGGGALAYLNQPRVPALETQPGRAGGADITTTHSRRAGASRARATLSVSPVIATDFGGLSLQGEF